MSTTFAIVSKNEEGEFERIDIAHRSSIGNGLVKIRWFDISLKDLYNILRIEKFNKLGFKGLNLSDVHVQAIDNTAQGVKTIGDLMVLDKYGSFKNTEQTRDIIKKADDETLTLKDENYYNSICEEFNKKFDVEEIDKNISEYKSNYKSFKKMKTDKKGE